MKPLLIVFTAAGLVVTPTLDANAGSCDKSSNVRQVSEGTAIQRFRVKVRKSADARKSPNWTLTQLRERQKADNKKGYSVETVTKGNTVQTYYRSLYNSPVIINGAENVQNEVSLEFVTTNMGPEPIGVVCTIGFDRATTEKAKTRPVVCVPGTLDAPGTGDVPFIECNREYKNGVDRFQFEFILSRPPKS